MVYENGLNQPFKSSNLSTNPTRPQITISSDHAAPPFHYLISIFNLILQQSYSTCQD
jgi:hypothetical protein